MAFFTHFSSENDANSRSFHQINDANSHTFHLKKLHKFIKESDVTFAVTLDNQLALPVRTDFLPGSVTGEKMYNIIADTDEKLSCCLECLSTNCTVNENVIVDTMCNTTACVECKSAVCNYCKEKGHQFIETFL